MRQHRPVGLEVLADDLETEDRKAAERGKSGPAKVASSTSRYFRWERQDPPP